MDETSIRERFNWMNSPLVIERIPEQTPPSGIKRALDALKAANIQILEAIEDSQDNARAEPAVRFHGNRNEGFRAMAIALQNGLKVTSLRRVWPIDEGEPLGPWWEMTFAAEQADLAPRKASKEIVVQTLA